MKSLTILTITLMSGLAAQGQWPIGTILESQEMNSQILGKTVRYTIYLPADYETSERHYPVVYLLHGYTGNDTDWLQFGMADHLAGEAIAKGEIPPMILVTPDGENNWYVNSYDDKIRFEDMFIQEFIPYIEEQYRIRKAKEFRSIAGLSMGGYGSLIMALRHPELFNGCVALSAAVITDEEFTELPQERYDPIFGNIFGPDLQGEARITDFFKEYSPLHIIANQPADSTARVRFYLDCGDDDWLSEGNARLHILMKQMEIPHEFRVRDGTHEWVYWRTGLVDGLKFLSKSFIR